MHASGSLTASTGGWETAFRLLLCFVQECGSERPIELASRHMPGLSHRVAARMFGRSRAHRLLLHLLDTDR
ncbi:hypothetical protein GCM10010532_113680 [Dactylosporangium siamense]|uniref:Uncharacterized protein n=1 Tax=Dactylosporangium siamense TaxID=685454 RepID=A0A919Q3G5_9ACTN|nr:hypothetical protein Dsi01nite_112210 [Dactylosporangium siamense]